jgi:hypothetical protein
MERVLTPLLHACVPSLVNPAYRGLMLFLNVTASPAVASSTLTLTLQAVEPVTGTVLYSLAAPTGGP